MNLATLFKNEKGLKQTELKPVIEILRLEWERQTWILGQKIGKLEHQRNKAREKHGVLKRKVREHRVMKELLVLEKLQRENELLKAELDRVRSAAIGQNDALTQANRQLRAELETMKAALSQARIGA